MIDKEFIAVFHYDDGGSNRCGTEPYRYAEEIVRCRECKYWQDNNGGYPHPDCRWVRIETPDADDYCSLGERKEGRQE